MTDRILSQNAVIAAIGSIGVDHKGCPRDLALDDAIAAVTALPEVGGLRYERANGLTLDQMRGNVSRKLYEAGDCVLIWVNEGDLCLLPSPPEANDGQ